MMNDRFKKNDKLNFSDSIIESSNEVVKPLKQYLNSSCNESKKYTDKITNIFKIIMPYIEKQQNEIAIISKELQPFIERSRLLMDTIKPLTKSIINYQHEYFDNLNFSNVISEVFKNFDWNETYRIYKQTAIEYLNFGYYPSFICLECGQEFISIKSNNKRKKLINNIIETNLPLFVKKFKINFPKYKREINEIYKLYKLKKYRLCTLSIINLSSVISNETFDKTDFTETGKNGRLEAKLRARITINKKEISYIIFSPYLNDKEFCDANTLKYNYREIPENYIKYPYNRNAIIHGYTKKINKEICFRWISVIMSLYDVIIKYIEK